MANTIPPTTDSQPRRWMTMAEIADMFGVTDRTIRRYIHDGRITAYRMGPRAIRLDPDEVSAQLMASRVPAEPEAS